MQLSKKWLIATAISAALLSTISNSSVTRLTSYTQLVQALKNGHRVTSVTEFKKCTTTGGTPLADEAQFDSVGLSFNQGFFLIQKLPNETQFSVGTIATNTIPGKNEGTYNRYKLIRVFEDDTATLSAIHSNAVTAKTIGWVEHTCKISQGNDQNGVSLFDYDAG